VKRKRRIAMSKFLKVSIDNSNIVLEHDVYQYITIAVDQVPQLVEDLLRAAAEINENPQFVAMEALKQKTREIVAAMEPWDKPSQRWKGLPATEKTTLVTNYPEWHFRAAVRAIPTTAADFDADGDLTEEAFRRVCDQAMSIVCELDAEEADRTGGSAYADIELSERFQADKIVDEEIRAAARGENITEMHGSHEPVLPISTFNPATGGWTRRR
jgi:hypothetical protein